MDEIPSGFRLRSVSVEDASAIAGLVNECMLAEIGFPYTTVEETLDDLTAPSRDGGRDDALLVEADGTPAGYLQFLADAAPFTEIETLAYVRPSLWGRGLNAWLLRLGEERARSRAQLSSAGERVALFVARFVGNEAAGRLFESLGFEPARTFWMMRMELAATPPTPVVPDGIRIRAFERERDEVAVHAALTEAFADHWGHVFPSFEQWRHVDLEGEGARFDPGLWFLAEEGSEVVGVCCCRASTPRNAETGQVNELAVRRPWRRRGVGLALLHSGFGELRRRGVPRVELGVDSESPTGATRLYERAGMQVAYAWEFWEKELRPAATASSELDGS